MNVSSDVSKFTGPNPNLFATPEWAETYTRGVMPISVGSETVTRAVLNLFSYKKFGKTLLINPPFAPNCGLSFQFDTDKRFSINTEVKRVMRSLAEYLTEKYSNAYIDIAFPPEIKDIQPFLRAGFSSDIAYTYRIDLNFSEKAILNDFSSERRKNVRDGNKAGLAVEFNKDPEALIELIMSTLIQSGLHYDRETLARMINQEWTFTVSVSNEARLLAAAVVGVDHNCAYYLAGGTLKNTKLGGAGALVLWEAVKKAKELNLRMFDFCGSSQPQIEKFFRGFGGELTPYFRVKNNYKLFDILKSTKEKFSSH